MEITTDKVKEILDSKGINNKGKGFNDAQMGLFTLIANEAVKDYVESNPIEVGVTETQVNSISGIKMIPVFEAISGVAEVSLKDSTEVGLISATDGSLTAELKVFGKVEPITVNANEVTNIKLLH